MIDYNRTRQICRDNSKLSGDLIDDFLISYASKQDRLDKEFDQKILRYKHITRKVQGGWEGFLKSQYIAHRIFKKDGLIQKYLHRSVLKDLSVRERSFLKQQASTPWRFSFSSITNNPDKDFYEMEDVFTGASYLLYSQGVSTLLTEKPVMLWLNLIGFNGTCWQSFGPIGAYQSFDADDIFFFASEIDPQIVTDEDVMASVEKNPLPYMMLLSGSQFPLTFHDKDQMVMISTEYDYSSLDPDKMTKDFILEYADQICLLKLKRWNSFPHFSRAYYDKEQGIMQLISMTDRGYQKLAEVLKTYGHPVSVHPDIRVSLPMLTVAGDILKKKIVLDEYESLFEKETSPEDKEGIDKINDIIGLILPDINAGGSPDIEALAKKTGQDPEMIKELIDTVNKMAEKQRQR